jgi:hypothetical protein
MLAKEIIWIWFIDPESPDLSLTIRNVKGLHPQLGNQYVTLGMITWGSTYPGMCPQSQKKACRSRGTNR